MAERKSKWLAFNLSCWLLAGLTANLAAVTFFAWLAGEVLEGNTLQFDEGVRELISRFASPGLTASMQAVTFVGSVFFLFCCGALVTFGFMLAKRRRALNLFLVTMAGATLLNVALKASFKRNRPESFFGTPLPSSFSFPSGHALLSTCFYCILAYLFASRIENPIGRVAVWVAAVLLVLAIGASRIYLGVHYPSDVIAGHFAAIAWVVTVVLLDRSALQRGRADSRV